MSVVKELRLVDSEGTLSAHHTELFPRDEFTVLRRGGAFDLAVDLGSSVEYALIQDVKLVDGSSEVKLRFTPSSTPDVRELRCRAEIPFNAPVGAYKLQATLAGPTAMAEARYLQRVLVLCNAWSVTDEVYLEEEAERREYVLEKNTRVYAGSV